MEMKTKKITCKVSIKLHQWVKIRMKLACLQRDLYLDIVLRHEAQMLDEEISQPNSTRGRLHLKQSLQRIDTTPVSLALSEETVGLINDVCDRKLIPRDSFINRIFLFLLMHIVDFDKLLGIDIAKIYRRKLLRPWDIEFVDLGLPWVNEEPFWVIRQCIEYANRDDPGCTDLLHQAFIDEHFSKKIFKDERLSLRGFNCFIDDSQIEETDEYLKSVDQLEKIFPLKKGSRSKGAGESK